MDPNLTALTERVANLERVVAEMRRNTPATSWLDTVRGSITDVEAFEEAMRLGREYRKTGRLPDDPGDEP
jgi:hypothetical protein